MQRLATKGDKLKRQIAANSLPPFVAFCRSDFAPVFSASQSLGDGVMHFCGFPFLKTASLFLAILPSTFRSRRRGHPDLVESLGIDCYVKPSNSQFTLVALMANSEAEHDVTRVLQLQEPCGGVSQELLPLVYKELRELAASRMARELEGQTLQPTALVHEAWLRLQSNSSPVWRNRAHFFGAASQAMRRILIERARRKLRLKRGNRAEHINIDNVDVAQTEPDERILLIDEALTRLNGTDPELARVVTLKFFGGLTNAEVAETLGVTERTIYNKWAFAKVWLLKNIREEWNPES
jgi:RNA polymerase sigma factor (TIGR02999 family)